MRFKRVELSPANKRQYFFAVGARDVELLMGMTIAANASMPVLKENKYDRKRIQAMTKGLAKAMEVIEHDNDQGTRIPVNERDQYSNEDTGNPLEDINRMEIIDHRPCDKCKGTGRVLTETDSAAGQSIAFDIECPNCQGMRSKGREVVFWSNKVRVEPSVQDGGKTLKLFVDVRRDDKGDDGKGKPAPDPNVPTPQNPRMITLDPFNVENFVKLLESLDLPRTR